MVKASRPAVFLVLLALASAPLLSSEEPEEIDLNAARANPVLRAFLSENSPYTIVDGPPDAESLMHDAWVDNQVEHFVRDIYRKMETLRAAVGRAQAARLEAVSGGPDAEAATARWKSALKDTEESSKSVRTAVANVLTDLRSHDKSKISISGVSKQKRFEEEMQLLSSELKLAEQAVSDYFFKPTHVTSVVELREANMLDFLTRVEKVARAVRQAL